MEHPITPPEELVQQWADKQDFPTFEDIATQAACWGADQELEACIAWMKQKGHWGSEGELAISSLRAARRPKPPSLAKQGCDALDTYIYGNPNHKDKERTYNTIRAALERLKELERGNE